MKQIIPVFLLLFLLVACEGKKTEKEVVVNPLWGMWVQEYPQQESKREMLLTEDKKGFVFVADTFQCELLWRQDSLLHMLFLYKNDTVRSTQRKTYEMLLDADTLYLKDKKCKEGEQAESKYVRYNG